MRTAIANPIHPGWQLLLACALAGCSSTVVPPGARCVVRDFRAWVPVDRVDYLDLLFVISDAPSMAEEQAQLAAELPDLVQRLITGETVSVWRHDRVQDLHVGIVSATLADGGALHHAPVPGTDGCASEYPDFLSFRGDYYGRDQDDPAAFAQSVQCLSRLDSASTRPNQALEAALEALSSPTATSGFLRNDPRTGLSLIAVVVVADTDDCSAMSSAEDAGQAPSTSAACSAQSDALQSLDRYLDGLRSVRAGNENLVLFAVIGGIPPALTQLGPPPFDLADDQKREAFYRRILDDPSMQPTVDPSAPQRLLPACSRGAATAEPARRLVSLAQRFGANGLPISLCDDHWTGALALLAAPLETRFDVLCVERPLARGADGRIPCKVYWDLPAPGQGPDTTPTDCSALPFLTRAPGASSHGGQRCEVAQAAISSDAELAAADPNAGFYFDDFSARTQVTCVRPVKWRIAFTDYARPPTAVSATLDCLDEPFASTGVAAAPPPAACNVAGSPELPAVNARSIGRPCMPDRIPEQGFDDREVWIETGADDCGTGVCMAFHLQGDPRPDCLDRLRQSLGSTQAPLCTTPDDIVASLYCSCRCRAPDPSMPTCTCPHGFSCLEVLSQGGPAFEGGYCVKDGTYADSWP